MDALGQLVVSPRGVVELVQSLELLVFGHHAGVVSGHPDADALLQYGCTVPAVYHLSAHAYTNHNGPNAVYDPMSASCYRNHGSVSGNIHTAHSEYIPAVQQ